VSARDGAIRLLQPKDLKQGVQNVYGAPLIGWRKTSDGARAHINPRGYACVWGVVQKMVAGEMSDLYEQPVIFENVGSVVACFRDDRVALVQSYRMVGERLLEGADYVRRLDDEKRWGEAIGHLGVYKWELPRGIPPTDTTPEDVIIGAAKLEALEEAGLKIEDAKVVGRINANPTFFAHPQYVVSGKIVARTQSRPEALEIIGKTSLFTPVHVREMVNRGELDDGLTLAALGICGYQY